ncbi:MAG: glycosyltransferase family 39 protein [Ignavibacteriaceae bacterium]|nr:glycosyltransferase family 39 protein [Ignavibacteriaceae bacterium]MCW9098639.1 glycosyltransferase family 39 protein [Ignavibacteriaceae bacterium]
MNYNSTRNNRYLLFILIIISGIIVRIYFQVGHIFSDDAYYSYLSYSLLKGEFAKEYLGYPVFSLRVAFLGLTSVSMKIFGTNEASTLLFPFIFSVINILLTYKIARLFTENDKVALFAAFLIAFFPTDVIFSTIGFPDLINVFFINLGIYFLLKSYMQKKIIWAYAGGISFFISMQFKENIYYTFILLIFLLVYFLLKQKQFIPQILIGLLFIAANFLIEGFAYLLLHNEFLYRITITNINYNYSFYDFFPYTARKLSGSKNYFKNLFDQIFFINAKSVFLRRFYLFLPLVSVVQTFFSFKKKNHKLLLFWFWGTSILLIVFTTSFTEYKPLDLTRSWYIYPLLMPMVILSAMFIHRFSKLVRNGLLVIYLLGSLIMCFAYQNFFDVKNLDTLKSFLRENSTKMIYTDHFTKYSVDLIRGYEADNSKRIMGKDFNFNLVNKGDWILFNNKHIEELEMQKYTFPDFSILNTNNFRKVAAFKDFIFYEKSD